MTHPLSAYLAHVAEAPDALAVVQGDVALTRAALLDRAGALASGLAERGVRADEPGARVLIHLGNSADMVALVLAIWSQGALPMFLSAKAPQSHLDGVIARLAPSLVVTQEVLEGLPRAGGMLGTARPGAEDDASVVFTSGSTGLPKGVVQKAGTLSSGAARVAATQGYGDHEHILVGIPFAHDYGWGQMLSGIVGGHRLILPEREILVDIGKAVTRHQPSVFAGVPSLYAALLFGISGFETAQTDSLRLMTSTGSAFSDDLYAALSARVPQARITRNYGLTETYRSCCRLPDHPAAPPNCIGKPILGCEIAIVDAEAMPLPAGAEGEIAHMGEGVFDRYLDDPEATAKARRAVNGRAAVFTGDIGVMDESGSVTLLGRRDRLVKSMDIRINLNDVEREVTTATGVAETAVVAVPNDRTGVEMTAFCVAPEQTPRDLRRTINRALPAHMRPRSVKVVEALPRTPVGKVDYVSLAKTAAVANE